MSSLSIIIPTFNEAECILTLLENIEDVISDLDHEIIIVDDNSADNTAEIVRNYINSNQLNNIHCIHRTWSKGLSSAVVEGISLASKELVCVMDGDGQHDPKDILKMLEVLLADKTDLVVGSRFLLSDHTHGFNIKRNRLSEAGIKLSNLFVRAKISDPLSGFFLTKRTLILEAGTNLYKEGFKILFDFMMVQPNITVSEVQINFKERLGGESKLNLSTFFSLIGQIVENLTKGIISSSFLVFSLVGSFGVLIHLSTLSILLAAEINFLSANFISTLLAMTSNYLLNNFLTFHNVHKSLKQKFFGLTKYTFVNSLSILANVGIAYQLFENNFSAIASALVGIVAGLILNYALSRKLVFNQNSI